MTTIVVAHAIADCSKRKVRGASAASASDQGSHLRSPDPARRSYQFDGQGTAGESGRGGAPAISRASRASNFTRRSLAGARGNCVVIARIRRHRLFYVGMCLEERFEIRMLRQVGVVMH